MNLDNNNTVSKSFKDLLGSRSTVLERHYGMGKNRTGPECDSTGRSLQCCRGENYIVQIIGVWKVHSISGEEANIHTVSSNG